MQDATRTITDPDAGSSLSREWHMLHGAVPERIRQLLASLVARHAPDLAGLFYDTLLRDEEAAPLLSHEVVSRRLHGSLQRWLKELFPLDAPAAFDAVAGRQRVIGAVHARVQVPLHLVMRGGRVLKARLLAHLTGEPLSREDLSAAAAYLFGIFDIALELMSTAFVQDTQQATTANEAFRLFTVGQDVTLERETQRGALLDWSQSAFFTLATGNLAAGLPPLSRSSFGFWLHHRAGLLFQEGPEYQRILGLVQRVDAEMLPAILHVRQDGSAGLPRLIDELQDAVKEIRFLLQEAFNNLISLENGRDPLTRTLNRRFLSSILSCEIAIAARHGTIFSVLMLDLDHFKAVNDRLGHGSGDAVLSHTAEIVLDMCRQSDFVFRYGGEEFLVVLVETGTEAVLQAAERIRARIAAAEFRTPEGQPLRITASIGAATFDGHPDYQRLIDRADKALYMAKFNGRNRVVFLPPAGAPETIP